MCHCICFHCDLMSQGAICLSVLEWRKRYARNNLSIVQIFEEILNKSKKKVKTNSRIGITWYKVNPSQISICDDVKEEIQTSCCVFSIAFKIIFTVFVVPVVLSNFFWTSAVATWTAVWTASAFADPHPQPSAATTIFRLACSLTQSASQIGSPYLRCYTTKESKVGRGGSGCNSLGRET